MCDVQSVNEQAHEGELALQNRTSILIDTKARVVEALKEAKGNAEVMESGSSSESIAAIYQKEIVEIDSLIKELEL